MATKTLPRTIKFEERTLADIPGFTKEQLKAHYAVIYQELVNATVQEEVTPKGIMITFTVGYKSKG